VKCSDRSLNYVYSPAFVWGSDDKHENVIIIEVRTEIEMDIALAKLDADAKSLNLELFIYSHGI
jgi:hypothetical protein